MGRHDQACALFYPLSEGDHLAGCNLLPGLQGLGIAVVAVRLGVAMARKMLEASFDLRILESVQEFPDHVRDKPRIAPERTVSDHDVLRIGVDIGDRSEVYIEPVPV